MRGHLLQDLRQPKIQNNVRALLGARELLKEFLTVVNAATNAEQEVFVTIIKKEIDFYFCEVNLTRMSPYWIAVSNVTHCYV